MSYRSSTYEPCPSCQRQVSITWSWCPYCGDSLDGGEVR